jgi:subtilisin family serine protease
MSGFKILSTALLVAILSAAALPATAQTGGPGVQISPDLQINETIDGGNRAGPALTGEIEVVVRLSSPSIAEYTGANGKRFSRANKSQQQAHKQTLNQQQQTTAAQLQALGGVEVARLTNALNAIVVRINASQLPAARTLPGVVSVRPVGDYELDLSTVVSYIGAAAVQAAGVDGTGVKVAVLDSGIDYTHFNLGGAGTLAAYEAAYGTSNSDPRNTTLDGLFPTAKVVGGMDFVGESWPNGDRTTDPDPIDYEGHGTHVADIIAGKSADGSHKGVAPGAQLFAVKVCSAVSSSCNGVALLLGVEYALDPNGDGSISDAVDVINMSLGSSYGQVEDDLSLASANAARFGVVVVASAGNSADRPYILGSPSSTPEVISVAQTQMPQAKLYRITVGSTTAGGNWQPWSAAPVAVSAPLQYGAAGNTFGCTDAAGTNPWSSNVLAGKIVLIDRGICAISIKVSNAAAAGAVAAIIANNASQAPGDLPPDFSFGGGTPTIPGYTVTRADGLILRTLAGQTVVIDPAQAANLAGNMVASSSRGPSYSFNAIKPDVGAPGASLSAEAGTGNGETAFGGTSGAAPVVAGSAALLLQKNPNYTPVEVKALLMNTGETNIGINPVSLPGVLAPITRIGGGEVRVNRAIATTTAAWDEDTLIPSLSFGYYTVASPLKLERRVRVVNYGNAKRTYTIQNLFRYNDDAASGAVTVEAPATLEVKAGGSKTFKVTLRIDPSRLPLWTLNGGSWGGDGFRLQGVEFDGYLRIAEGADSIQVPWQVLPHRAADVKVTPKRLNMAGGGNVLRLSNSGAVDARVDVFALTGISPKVPDATLPMPGDNFAIIDMKFVGARLASAGSLPVVQFAINTFRQRSHPAYPAEFDVYIDTNNDGTPDYVMYTAENGSFASTGQTLVYVANLAGGPVSAFFFADADLNSGNMIMTAPLSALGLTPNSKFTFSVYAFDNYFTGNLTDALENMVFTPGTPRFATDAGQYAVPAGTTVQAPVITVAGGDAASPAQQGFLFMYRDGLKDAEAEAILVR